MAQEFAGRGVLFICDIGLMDEVPDEGVKEQCVQVDMVWQEKSVSIMKPKLGIPASNSSFSYFAPVYLQSIYSLFKGAPLFLLSSNQEISS